MCGKREGKGIKSNYPRVRLDPFFLFPAFSVHLFSIYYTTHTYTYAGTKPDTDDGQTFLKTTVHCRHTHITADI